MDIDKYIGINVNTTYTTEELNNILSNFNNLNMGNYYMNGDFIKLLSEQPVLTITKFISMFKDINEFEHSCEKFKYCHSVAGNILYIIARKDTYNKICVYKIMDYLFKQGMNTKAVFVHKIRGTIYDIKFFCECCKFAVEENYDDVTYIVNNYDVIQNVRKLINNYDILLFDITDDLQFIELILLISKCKQKNLPKFVIMHKILYYYLLDENIMC